MTAPAIAQAPAAPTNAAPAPVVEPVTQSPVVETQPTNIPASEPVAEKPEKPIGLDAMINKITKQVTPEALAEPAAPGAEAAIGGEALASSEGAPTGDTPATPANMVMEIVSEEPDGQVVLRARDPKTGQFSEMDQSRTYEMAIKDPITGEKKVYEKTLPDLMRMAKDGVAMQKSRDELAYYRENAPQWQQTHQAQEARLNQLDSLARQLLTAPPEEVDAIRQEYAKSFTPEAENQRLKAEIERMRTRPAATPSVDPQAQQVQQYLSGFAQRTATVLQEVEGLVGKEAAVGKMATFAMPLMVNGRIPPERLPDVERFIAGPYRQWAQTEAATRTAAQTATQQQLDAARRTQQQAQLAARSVGSATRPTGGTPSSAQAPQTKPKNVNEAMERIIRGRPVAAAG